MTESLLRPAGVPELNEDLTVSERHVHRPHGVERAEATLRRLIAESAPERAIDQAAGAIVAAQSREKRRSKKAAERQRIEREVRREKARAESARLQKAADDAERALRTGASAPVVVIDYHGLIIRVCPEASPDPVIRQSATEALRRALHTCMYHFEQSIGAAKVAAQGRTPRPVRDTEWLRNELADVLRAGIKHGTVTIA